MSATAALLKLPEFKTAWGAEDVVALKAVLGTEDWWSVKSNKKGLLLHAAARQSKHLLLAAALPSLESYCERWPHEQIPRGLLETLAKTNTEFERLEPWMALGIGWGSPTHVNHGMLFSLIKAKSAQHCFSLSQLERVIEYGERSQADVWRLNTPEDARMDLLRRVEAEHLEATVQKIPNFEELDKGEVLDVLFERNFAYGLKTFESLDWSVFPTERAQLLKDKYVKLCLTRLKFDGLQKTLSVGGVWPSTLEEDVKTHVLPRLNKKTTEPFHRWVERHVDLSLVNTASWIEALIKAGKIKLAQKTVSLWGVDISQHIQGRPLGLTCSKKKTSWLETLREQMSDEGVEKWLEQAQPIASAWWVSEMQQIMLWPIKRKTFYLDLMEQFGVPMDPHQPWSDEKTTWSSCFDVWAKETLDSRDGWKTAETEKSIEEFRSLLEHRFLMKKHAPEKAFLKQGFAL